MDEKWIWAGVAVAAGLVLGGLAARIARSLLADEKRPEGLRNSAGAIASLVFSLAVIIGLVVALGIVNRDSLEELPTQLVDYIPRALSAAIVIIGANVVASFAVTAVEQSLGHVSSSIRRWVPTILRASILFAAGLIAANQLGVDTTILILAAAALFFSVGLAAALLAGLGGRDVSAEVAAGRAVRRVLDIGDHVDTADATGTIIDLHGVAAEIESSSGERMLVPYSALLDGVVGLRRQT